MCEKCVELNGKIAHLKMLSAHITDKQTLEGMAILTERYKAQKRELHPGED